MSSTHVRAFGLLSALPQDTEETVERDEIDVKARNEGAKEIERRIEALVDKWVDESVMASVGGRYGSR
jgi:hypothetical protein